MCPRPWGCASRAPRRARHRRQRKGCTAIMDSAAHSRMPGAWQRWRRAASEAPRPPPGRGEPADSPWIDGPAPSGQVWRPRCHPDAYPCQRRLGQPGQEGSPPEEVCIPVITLRGKSLGKIAAKSECCTNTDNNQHSCLLNIDPIGRRRWRDTAAQGELGRSRRCCGGPV